MKKKIEIPELQKSVGHYAQAISLKAKESDFVFVSGQLPIDPDTGKVINGPIKECVKRIFKNISQLLNQSNMTLEDVVRVEIFLKNIDDLALVNQEYALYFSGPLLPTRQTIQVARLPFDALIEISCIAAR